MNRPTGKLQNGIASRMEPANVIMKLNKATNIVSPVNEAPEMMPPAEPQPKRNNGLTILAAPTPTAPKELINRRRSSGTFKKSNFASKLRDYPLHTSIKRQNAQPPPSSRPITFQSVPSPTRPAEPRTNTQPQLIPQQSTEVAKTKPQLTPQQSTEVANTKPKLTPQQSIEVANTKPQPTPPQSTKVVNTQPQLTPPQSTKVANTKPQSTPPQSTKVANTKPQLTPPQSTKVVNTNPQPISPKPPKVANVKPQPISPKPAETAKIEPPSINKGGNETKNDTPGRTAASLTDPPLTRNASVDQPQKTFVLRKVHSPEQLTEDAFKRLQFQSRRLNSFPNKGEETSSQIFNNSFHNSFEAAPKHPLSGGSLLSPKDSVKSRSEYALSTLDPADQVVDPRRHVSQNNLHPPDSPSNRRDQAWTAEVLSIEIQVDYVMDPEELWGQSRKQLEDDEENIQTIILPPPRPTQPEPEEPVKNEKSEPIPEVAVVIPMVTETPGDGGDDGDKRSDNCVENGAPPEEPEPTKDPRRSLDSIELNLPPREHWTNRGQFLLSTIGYAVDLSNVWRFPFLCYKNGGGAFLIPYFITLIFGAMPVFFMEMCLGQFHRCGPTAIWEKMSPMFKGIGIASCFMSYVVGFYYNVIIAWSFFYLFASFTSKLPWTTCFNKFNSDNCWQIDWDTNTTAADSASDTTDSVAVARVVGNTRPLNWTYNVSISVSATIEYFERGMLELNHSKGMQDLGVIKWELALCTLLTFTLLYFCLWKGVKSTGKVVYITATLPYLIMTILLVRGVLLPGAGEGIRYFITPKFEHLNKPKVWIDAAVQIFFSIGSGFGTHIAYASYNKFHNNCRRDCIVTVAVNSFTSLFSGVVIFSYLGYMSLKTQKDIDKVATEGPGLVFIVYPEAIATLPGSVFWAILFFFMLLALGLDSAFGGLESPLTGIRDEFSHLMKYRYFREVITLIVIVSAFLFAIPCVLQGGVYVFTILDTFAAGTSIVFIVLCEVVAVSWFYGTPQFCADVEKMIGDKPGIFWRVSWKFVCPVLLTLIVISSIASYQPLTYRSSQGVYTFPFYANVIGWCIACTSMFMVPGYIIYRLLRNKGSCSQRFALAITPTSEHESVLETKVVTRFQRQHWLSL